MTAPSAPGTAESPRIFRLWAPIAATWLMMSTEGLLIAAVVARLDDATVNLAAYGVAFAFGLIFEAPIIMLLSASTALSKDRDSFLRLRRFGRTLNVGLSVLLLAFVLTPAYPFVGERLMGLSPEVSDLSRWTVLILLPWPGAIGYRRFYQGILIRAGHTRKVAYGTLFRLGSMILTAGILFGTSLPGAFVGGVALSVAVMIEAVATRRMAAGCVREVMRVEPTGERLDTRGILHFYVPLMISSVIALAMHPIVNLSLGHSRMALASLAAYPVVTALSFVFRSMGLSFQEVAIALMDGSRERFRRLFRFALLLGVSASAVQGVVAFTPLSAEWFARVAGLTPELVELAVPTLRILAIMPLLSVLLALARALHVWSAETRAITWAGMLEIGVLFLVLYALIVPAQVIGVFAAAFALLAARCADLGALYRTGAPVVRRLRASERPVAEAAGAVRRSETAGSA